ncbi:hypothetical protein [Phocaeicola salanitronis]|uniref:hypothetical protein n=1 Tax=Phocaeicola salanitronis TaxID=376805 RepID=UPI000A06D747|nr:hypothetical protein [Phocaeicola salanitronis]
MRKIAGYLTKNRSGKDQKIAQSTHENEHIKPRKTFWRNSKRLLNMNSSFGRGVSHTPESIHVDKLVYPGVCDTPLHVCKKAHAFLSYYNVRTGTI